MINEKQAQLEAKNAEISNLMKEQTRLQQEVKNALMKSETLQSALNETAKMNTQLDG